MRYDWAAIAKEYIEGWEDGRSSTGRRFPSLDDLAEKHGCAKRHIRRRSVENRWPERRKRHQEQAFEQYPVN